VIGVWHRGTKLTFCTDDNGAGCVSFVLIRCQFIGNNIQYCKCVPATKCTPFLPGRWGIV
jgi:hypothetical protein